MINYLSVVLEIFLIHFVNLFLTYLDDEPYFQDRHWFDALIYFHWMLLSVKTSSVFWDDSDWILEWLWLLQMMKMLMTSEENASWAEKEN